MEVPDLRPLLAFGNECLCFPGKVNFFLQGHFEPFVQESAVLRVGVGGRPGAQVSPRGVVDICPPQMQVAVR